MGDQFENTVIDAGLPLDNHDGEVDITLLNGPITNGDEWAFYQ